MTERAGVTSFPLYWPPGWPRTEYPTWSKFGRGPRTSLTVLGSTQRVRLELDRLGAENVVISSNLKLRSDGVPIAKQSAPRDGGASVWFELDSAERVLACDRWGKVEENLHAIALQVDALRGQERWGVGSMAQAFAGYTALPANASRPWWEVLEVLRDAAPAEIKAAFQRLAPKRHPDGGGTPELLDELLAARKQAEEATR